MPLPPEIDRGAHGLDPVVVDTDTYDAPTAQAWTITDDRAAEWAMRHAAQATDRIADVQRQAAEWRQQIDDWAAAESRREQHKRDFFEGKLIGYVIQRRMADPEHKTLRLPSGTISTRPTVAVLAFSDAVLERWRSEDRADLIRVKVEPDIKAIREAFAIKDDKLVDKETGVIVEGATVTQPSQPYSVSFSYRGDQ